MRAIVTIMRGNLRKGKGAFISVMILMLVLSMTLTAVLTVNLNSSKRDTEALREAGYGDMIAAIVDLEVEKTGMTTDELYQKIEDADVVEHANQYDCIYFDFKNLNGYSSSSSLIGFQYDPAYYDFEIYTGDGEGVYTELPELKDGEVCVPISYQSLYNCKIGDTMDFITDHGSETYTIKCFFEDPFMGSSMMGIKTVLLTEHDLTQLREEGYQTAIEQNGESNVTCGTFIDVFKSDSADSSSLKFVQELNSQTGLNDYAWITMTTVQASSYMLLLVNIFCGVLIGFVIILLIITIIIIGHSISSSIEQDYVNLGVLKALGVSQGKLKKVLMLQYGLAAVVGSVIGMPLAIPFIVAVNRLTRPITCLYVSSKIAFLPCIGVLLVILLLIELYTIFKLRKITHIKPVRAISGGKDDVYFSSRLQLPIRKRGLSIWMALRQTTSNLKQYIGVSLITMLLVFFLIMISGMCMWMGKDGSNLAGIFNCYENDIDIRYHNEDIREAVEQTIEDKAGIVHHYTGNSLYLNLNNCNMYCFIYSDPEGYTSVLEGRVCQYDNEILITEFIANDLGLGIGDMVTVTTGDKSAEYVVSGLYQSSNDLGSNFSMLMSGYERLTGHEMTEVNDLYAIGDPDQAEAIVEELENQYGKDQIKCSASSYNDIIEPIITATDAITMVVYILTVIFVLVIVVMLCTKIFSREKMNNGIYKAEGFSTASLRHQFAVRFLLVGAVGSLFGLIMVWTLSDFVMATLFSYVGVSDVNTNISLVMYVIPIIFMLLLFYLFSYLVAGRLKRVHPRILISD